MIGNRCHNSTTMFPPGILKVVVWTGHLFWLIRIIFSIKTISVEVQTRDREEHYEITNEFYSLTSFSVANQYCNAVTEEKHACVIFFTFRPVSPTLTEPEAQSESRWRVYSHANRQLYVLTANHVIKKKVFEPLRSVWRLQIRRQSWG